MSKYAKLYLGHEYYGVVSARDFGRMLLNDHYACLKDSPWTLRCPNPNCGARLTYCGGSSAHFAASFKDSKHSDDCDNCCKSLKKIKCFCESDGCDIDIDTIFAKICTSVSLDNKGLNKKESITDTDSNEENTEAEDYSDIYQKVFKPKTATDIYDIIMANGGDGVFAKGEDFNNKLIGKYSISDLRNGEIDIDGSYCTVVATGKFPNPIKVPGKKGVYYDPEYEGNSRRKGYRIVHNIDDADAGLILKFRDPYKSSYINPCIHYIVRFADKSILDACFKNKQAYYAPVLITGKWQKETFNRGDAYVTVITNPKQFVLLAFPDESEPKEVLNLLKK